MRTSEDLENVVPTGMEAEDVPNNLEVASFGMGCFWSVEALFGSLKGVYRTRVGYTGGKKKNPTYRAIGDHTETVQIEFKPSEISYSELLDIFLSNHDYGTDRKPQYASRVFYHNQHQKKQADRKLEDREASTTVEEIETFWLAEDYHQKYRLRQYPGLMELFSDYSPEEFIQSFVAMRLNAAVAGSEVTLESFLKDDELEKAKKIVKYR